MVTAAVATAFRVTKGMPLLERLDVLNQEVMAVGKDKYQMTLAAIDVSPQSGEFRYVSAGSPAMLSLETGASRPRAVPARGTPLGTKAFQPGVVDGVIDVATRLLIYTDGIPETPDANGRLLGMRRFSKLFAQTAEMPLAQAADSLVFAADEVRGTNPQDDDWTFVMVERLGA